MERAELGIDGNCGFALLGDDLQVGEAEFVEVRACEPGNEYWAKRAAAYAAYRKLKERLKGREFSYFIGPSHPSFYC